MAKVTFSRFDAAEHLETEEDIAVFLDEISADGEVKSIVLALGIAARARNMSDLARSTGITRSGLYKALSPGGNPSFETVAKVAKGLGFKLTLQAVEHGID
jgi:probable addiction module antidote protein